jgi:hypothetical protein
MEIPAPAWRDGVLDGEPRELVTKRDALPRGDEESSLGTLVQRPPSTRQQSLRQHRLDSRR